MRAKGEHYKKELGADFRLLSSRVERFNFPKHPVKYAWDWNAVILSDNATQKIMVAIMIHTAKRIQAEHGTVDVHVRSNAADLLVESIRKASHQDPSTTRRTIYVVPSYAKARAILSFKPELHTSSALRSAFQRTVLLASQVKACTQLVLHALYFKTRCWVSSEEARLSESFGDASLHVI